jgi:hypothetical protein
MHQNPLKILCAYHDKDADWLGSTPEEALEDHKITVVHSYREAKECILDTSRGIPTFDVILSDVSLPGGYPDEEPFPFCPVMLQPYIDQMLIRGLGVFVPREFESVFETSDGYSVTVASKECWTQLGKRDWEKLLEMVTKASAESDTFNTREPQEGNG